MWEAEMKLYQLIAETVAWKPTAGDWQDNREKLLHYIEKSLLPSGSGIDCGTKIDRHGLKTSTFRLFVEFHHMDENGSYDGWTVNNVTVRPSMVYGFTLHIGGRDKNQIKDYLGEVYDACLREEVDDEKLKKELWK
jgi:hypothetical protein